MVKSPNPRARIDQARDVLRKVSDPELPPLSIIDLGIIADVREDGDALVVDMTPTFAGCPALDMIRNDITTALRSAGEDRVVVNVVFDPPWTTDRMSEEGRRVLRELGIAPPGSRCSSTSLPELEQTPCPNCGSKETDLESIFGPTLCRSIHYCRECRQSFEHFKPV